MTENQTFIFYLGEYLLTFALLAACWFKGIPFDLKKSISKKPYIKRIALSLAIVLLGILAMTGTYLLRLPRETNVLVLGVIQIIMTPLGNLLLFSAWIQKLKNYPRGNLLGVVMILLYLIADLFMPIPEMKYAALVVFTFTAFALTK